MTPPECLRLLGLGDVASVEEIKRAYRQLAQQVHPDKHGGDDLARQRFVEISNAYRLLMRVARAAEAGRAVGTCCSCLIFSEIVRGPDGRARCLRCALQGSRRFLPLPTMVVVKCLASTGLLAAAAYLLVLALTQRSTLYAAGAFMLGMSAMSWLAYTCLKVVYCIQPREQARQSQKPERPNV